MGIMAKIGQVLKQRHYNFTLIGISPEDLVTWPGGPRNTNFLWWGTKRWELESHYSHFILVPGTKFGDESPWIVAAATILSKGNRAVTILLNGGDVSKRDIDLSLEHGRPVIAISHTGRLADEFASQIDRNKLITVVPANAEAQIAKVLQTALSDK